jgi:hypothetical protein
VVQLIPSVELGVLEVNGRISWQIRLVEELAVQPRFAWSLELSAIRAERRISGAALLRAAPR